VFSVESKCLVHQSLPITVLQSRWDCNGTPQTLLGIPPKTAKNRSRPLPALEQTGAKAVKLSNAAANMDKIDLEQIHL
jgi:hypothetical protein